MLNGTPRSRNAAVFGVGAQATMTKTLAAFANYICSHGSSDRSDTLLVGLRALAGWIVPGLINC